MLKYDLSRMVNKPKGTRVTLPSIAAPLAVELQYLVILRKMLSAMAAEVRMSVIATYSAERAYQRRQARLLGDADESWFARLRALTASLVGNVTRQVNALLRLEAQKHDANFMAIAKKALGIDLKGLVHEEDLEEYLRTAAARNAGLITNLSEQTISRIQQTVYSHTLAGGSVGDLRTKLKADFGLSDTRAKLIARDQTSKFNADLTRVRQQQAGIDRYTWQTSHDERVRPRHQKIDGTEYKWGEPTGAEDGLPPGQPIQCRCTARAIIVF